MLALQGRVVGIVTHYGADSLEFESWWEQDCLYPSRLALGPTQPPEQWVLCLLSKGKAAKRGVERPPPSGTEVKGRAQLYHYSPSGPSWPVLV
jgi:hypothetical protein